MISTNILTHGCTCRESQEKILVDLSRCLSITTSGVQINRVQSYKFQTCKTLVLYGNVPLLFSAVTVTAQTLHHCMYVTSNLWIVIDNVIQHRPIVFFV